MMCHWHCTGIQLEITSRPPASRSGRDPEIPDAPAGFGMILPRSRPNLEIDRRELNSDFPRAGLGQLEIGIIASGKSRRARIMSAQAANSKFVGGVGPGPGTGPSRGSGSGILPGSRTAGPESRSLRLSLALSGRHSSC